MRLPPFTLLLIFLLVSCSPEQEKTNNQTVEQTPAATAVQKKEGCIACHSMSLDPAHTFECTVIGYEEVKGEQAVRSSAKA